MFPVVLVVTRLCCDIKNKLLWLVWKQLVIFGGARRPEVWTRCLFFFVVTVVLMRFLILRNLASVLNGRLDAPTQGLLGLFFPLFSTENFFFGFDNIYTSFLQSSGPQGALCRCSGRSSPLFYGLVPHGLYLVQTLNTQTHTHLHTGSPNTQMDLIFSISTVYSLTKTIV